MTQQDDPYVRLPFRMVEDEIYLDDQLFAWWARLKIDADGMHPAPAPLPRRIPDEVVERLVELGHIKLTGPGDDRYFMRAVDEDRAVRSAGAKRAADARWAAERARKAAADAPAMRPHPTTDAPASEPEANAPESSMRPHPDALRAHDGAHHPEDASPLRSAPSESSVAGPPARPGAGGPARLADLLPPPPGHPGPGSSRLPPPDEDQVARQHAALLADPRCSPDLRRNAEAELRSMGRADLIPVAVNGR